MEIILKRPQRKIFINCMCRFILIKTLLICTLVGESISSYVEEYTVFVSISQTKGNDVTFTKSINILRYNAQTPVTTVKLKLFALRLLKDFNK